MPFLRREQIDPTLRARFEADRKNQLRQALLEPGLSKDQVARVKKEIKTLGQTKVYGVRGNNESA